METGRLSLGMSADPAHGYLPSKLLLVPLCDLYRMIVEFIDPIGSILRVNEGTHNHYFGAVPGKPGWTVALGLGKLLEVSFPQSLHLKNTYLQRNILTIKLIDTCKILRRLPGTS